MAGDFNAAKMIGADDKVFERKYNYLVDLVCQNIRILNAVVGEGLALSGKGVLSLGNELSALQLLADTAGFLKKTGDGAYAIDITEYQPRGNELDALQALSELTGLVRKLGDGSYEIDDTDYSSVASSSIWGGL
jgi:hypothetical protein